jgi:hypothetical protein
MTWCGGPLLPTAPPAWNQISLHCFLSQGPNVISSVKCAVKAIYNFLVSTKVLQFI